MSGNTDIVYLSPHSILVMTRKRTLIRRHCPFQVEAITEEYGLEPGRKYYVTLVRNDPLMLMLYCVGNLFYPYSAFRILPAEREGE